jgi:sugar lactone lactonase YvrE
VKRGIADALVCAAMRCAWRRAIVGALVMTLALALGAAGSVAPPALALPSEIGEEGEGAGQFSGGERNAAGIAINQEVGKDGGDVYIADTGNNRVVQFSGEGQFIRAWGFGVADGESEAFQVCNAPGPCFAGIPGPAGGQLSAPKGIAVDNSAGLTQGDVYVQDTANNRIERYGPDGEFILAFGGEVNKTAQEKGETANENVCPVNPGDVCQAGSVGSGASQFEGLGKNGIAVGPGGTVYVGDISRVQKFAPSGAPEGEIAIPGGGAIEGLAVDSSGDLYVLREVEEGVRKFDGTGTELGEARDPGLGLKEPSIALGASGRLIVADPKKEHLFAYDPAGAQLLSLSLPSSPDARGGIAFGDASEALYVLHNAPARVALLTLPPPGPLILKESASEVLPVSAKLNATVNPEGPEPTSCHFQYGTSVAYGSETAETPLEGGPFEDQSISAAISGLQPSSEYHFRAVCENAAKEAGFGPDQSFTTAPPVSIDGESVSAVTSTSAKLLTELNAHGLPSEFHFEYGLSSSYEKSVPVPDASAGAGGEDAVFSVKVQELLPSHTYHFRVVAHNSLGVSVGEDRTFTTQGEAPVLADGRAYEMVSPPNKHGVSLEAITREGGLIEAAAGGSALAYIALGPIDPQPQGNRSVMSSEILSRRGAGVWSTEDIATPHRAVNGVVAGNPSEYRQFSADLSRGAVEPEGATPLAPEDPANTEKTPYRREANGAYTPLVSAANVPAGTKFGGTENPEIPEAFNGGVTFITGSEDMRHVLLRSPSSLVQGFEAGGEESIYEWSEGKLEAVSILPGGAPAAEEGTANVGNQSFQVRGAISKDGGRVFFETSSRRRLYVRDLARGETLRVDGAEAGVKASEGGATFQLATGDGSKVFFTDAARLTKDSTAKGLARDLYECTIVTEGGKLACELKDLSADSHAGEAADVQGAVLGADQSGRFVYFVARGALAQGAVSGSCPDASEGQCVNLYEADTQADTKRLVAALAQGDFPDWSAVGGRDLGEMTSRVSPSGRYLAFMSQRPLTGFDNHDAKSGARDEEVFLYDNQAGLVRCASCDPSGQRPAGVFDADEFPGLLVDRPRLWGEVSGGRDNWLAGSIPGWTRVDASHALHQARYLSDEGRLFFNTPLGLVAGDGNGTQDVYEYEPAGVGSCQSAQGCVNLISAGSSSEESALLDASENGGDVFFLTAAQLSGEDKDNAFDVYDAHVCSEGGCPAQAIGSPPPCASADACRAAPTPQPGAFSAPASSTFSGAGNPTPALTPPAPPKPKAKPTRAQQLAKALAACKKKPKRKQAACRRQAHKRYGAKAKAKKGSAKKRGRK